MNEQKNYCEYIYKTEPSLKKNVAKVLLITMYTVFTVLYLLVFWLAFRSIALLILLPFIMFAMIRVTWRLVSTEYEISVEAGELKISVIYGKAGRKTKFRYDVSEMCLIAPYDDAHLHLFEGGDISEIKYFVNPSVDDTFMACVCPDRKKSVKTVVVFNSCESMKKLFRISNPSAFRI